MSRKVPPFNDLVQPNMSEEAKAVMELAMQRSCDEQADFMKKLKEDYGETVKRLGEK